MGYFLVRREVTTDERRVDEVRSVRIKDEVKQGVLGKVQNSQLQWGEVEAPMGLYRLMKRVYDEEMEEGEDQGNYGIITLTTTSITIDTWTRSTYCIEGNFCGRISRHILLKDCNS